jgi:DNA-directed RNA polymerase subunit L
MEIKILENKAKRLVFQLVGADHTFCNALKKELNNVTGVEIATYAIEHPQIGIPKMLLETNDKVKPIDALTKVTKAMTKMNKEFSTAFAKAAK